MKPLFIKMPATANNTVLWKPNGLHRVVKVEKSKSYKGDKLTVKVNTGGVYTEHETWFTDQGAVVLHDIFVYLGLAIMGMILLVVSTIIYFLW